MDKQKSVVLLFSLVLSGIFISECADSSSVSVGKSGSLARFAIYGDYLYTVSAHNLSIFDISKKYRPRRTGSINIESTLETIFLYKKNIYLGTQEGILIYDLENPENPRFLGSHEHVLSCDPVVVENDIAYVTISSGNRCMRGRNALQIFDVSSPVTPSLISEYAMSRPGGLGIDGQLLFVVDEGEGIKIYDVRDPYRLKKLGQLQSFTGYDVIPVNNVLVVSAEEGLLFFDYENLPARKLGQLNIFW